MVSWRTYTDSGYPNFTQTDNGMSIVCGPGDRGRWLGNYLDPIAAGDKLTVFAQAKSTGADDSCSTMLLVWWKNEPGLVFHSSVHIGEVCGIQQEFEQFELDFIVPDDVKALRIDLRAWSGAGTFDFKDVVIKPTVEAPPDPPEPPEPPKPPYSLTIDLDLETVIWRITANVDSVTALRIPNVG